MAGKKRRNFKNAYDKNGRIRARATYNEDEWIDSEITYDENGYLESLYLFPDFIEDPGNQDLLNEIRDKDVNRYLEEDLIELPNRKPRFYWTGNF